MVDGSAEVVGEAASAAQRASGNAPPERWSLNRAGIINVYQYENETLHFGGGRLLLRGVNGSGKSTAMNMLLPFLLTASLRRIDAAGEQTGVLKSWMLSGRDDPQPLGYLWIELVSGSETLVCGCGVKANRSTDTLRTWWFLTDRRPGKDLSLVERGVPLSDDALRSELGPEAVFPHDRRADYRTEVRRRLFGGADLEQHLQLLNAVRNPRVGDRIDLDLPAHLTNALPELSDRAVAEAARPLDDLDEHRRNVGALVNTSEALAGMADVYRSYVRQYCSERVEAGSALLATIEALDAEASSHRQARNEAEHEKVELEGEIDRLGVEEQRLLTEISALKESPTYRDGSKLAELEERVRDAEQIARRLGEQLTRTRERLTAIAGGLRAKESATDGALEELAAQLDSLGRLRTATNVSAPSPVPPTIARTPIADDHREPDGPFDSDPLIAALVRLEAATVVRRSELSDVLALVARVDEALDTLGKAEDRRADRAAAAERSEADVTTARRDLGLVTQRWDDDVAAWRGDSQRLVDELAAASPEPLGLLTADTPSGRWPRLVGNRPTFADHGDRAGWRDQLLGQIDDLVTVVQRAVARARSTEEQATEIVDVAREEVGRLEAISEPEPPALSWQRRRGPCLADLIDFEPGLASDARAGLEAALEASGLLTATVAADGLVLEDGDLVLVGDERAPSPLSDLVTVTVPTGDRADRGSAAGPQRDDVPGADLIAEVLRSISTVVGGEWPASVGVDGRFRLGAARGRHKKQRPEYIGATARRETLERLRNEARSALARAEADLVERTAVRTWLATRQQQAEDRARALPTLTPVERAGQVATQAEHQLAESRERLAEADHDVAVAEASHRDRAEQAERTARTLQLPADRAGLVAVQQDLGELRSSCSTTLALAKNVASNCEQWASAAETWRQGDEDRVRLEAEHQQQLDHHEDVATKLATLRDSIGLAYREVVETIAVSERDLRAVRHELPLRTGEREEALVASVKAEEQIRSVDGRRQEAEADASAALDRLDRALALSGVVEGLTGVAPDRLAAPTADEPEPLLAVVSAIVGPAEQSSGGYRRRIDQLTELLTLVGPPSGPATTSSEGLRLSLRPRREAHGSGRDADARQPDARLPIVVEVEGPLGQMPLPAANQAAAEQLARLSALLTAKQDDALRGLLEGLVANEVATKMDIATRLVRDMNQHLRKVKTAHGLGVELRWRRRAELVDIDGRMIELLAKLPDLRTEDETRELRQLVSAQLSEARALEPEASYRELIATSLDYRRWHEMTVLTRWGDAAPTKLGRNHRFSEGEKKLVTYLPFLAAVAVSCDALAEHDPAAPRFVLLDDAMAKVSEDNHADLLGLLVDLDLDFIATSERLWGTHGTVPALAITEVVRDADLGVILLDHFHWDGNVLANRPGPTDLPERDGSGIN